jgi:DNA-directed RNA polymerase specialized sigma24 family protein
LPNDSSDQLLRDYFEARDETASQLILEQILARVAQPIIRRIVTSALRGPAAHDGEDVVSDTIAHLLRRLVELKADPSRHSIRSFAAYVATSAYNNCHERLRQSYPARNRLRNQLHYLLNHHPDFALWRTASGESVCGYRQWIGQPARVEQLDHVNVTIARPGQTRADIVVLVGDVFRSLRSPMAIDLLVDVIAKSIDLGERRVEPVTAASEPFAAPVAESQLELRMSLRQLWDDIRALPQRQRTALLFSLRDVHGQEILSLLPVTRTATLKEISEALQMPLTDLASLWAKLPLDDVAIGKLVGASRQQVIKLRRLAREKLHRVAKRREKTVTSRAPQNVKADSASAEIGQEVRTTLGGTTLR